MLPSLGIISLFSHGEEGLLFGLLFPISYFVLLFLNLIGMRDPFKAFRMWCMLWDTMMKCERSFVGFTCCLMFNVDIRSDISLGVAIHYHWVE